MNITQNHAAAWNGTRALFSPLLSLSFSLGTDPQAFLLIEARRVDGSAQWQYALARMNSVHLRATYRGREVWDVPTLPWDDVYDHRGPYTNFKFDRVEAAARPKGR